MYGMKNFLQLIRDFHLKVLGWNSQNVDFVDGGIFDPQLWVFSGGIWEQYDIDWEISPDGSQMDITFYDNPIEHGELAWIQAYTDNTSHCSIFYVKAYPTPIPEPVTIAFLGLGALAIIRKR